MAGGGFGAAPRLNYFGYSTMAPVTTDAHTLRENFQ